MKKYVIVKLSVFSIVSIAFVFYLVYYSNALAAEVNTDNNFFSCETIICNPAISAQEDSLVKTFNVNPKGSLYVKVPGSDIEVKTWDKNEVKVVVFRKGSEEQIRNFEILFNATEDKVTITAQNHKRIFNWSNCSIKFLVTVPKQFYPDLNTSGGDIVLSDLLSDSKINTSGGDVKVYNSTGRVNAGTSGGDIHVINNNGDVRLETSGGDIVITDVYGKVNAETSGGDIKLKLNGVNKGVSLNTSGGDIRISIPQELKADLDCKTSGGDVSMNGPAYFQGKMKEHSINGTINGGGELVRAETSGGDITIDLRK